ncbi:MAG: hypothetical protein ACO1N0_20140 [Fluviicola sp.]
MSLLQKWFFSFLLLFFGTVAAFGQEIVADSIAKRIFCIVVSVADFQKNEPINDYNLIINGKKQAVSDRDLICVKLAEGATYAFKIEKAGFTSPEYQWEYKDEMNDRRKLTFYLFPSGITEKEKQKWISKRNKELAKTRKKGDCNIEGWYHITVY